LDTWVFTVASPTTRISAISGEAADGKEAVALARDAHPDLLPMDVQMPVMDGLGAIAELLDGETDTKVLILTTFERDDYVFAALRAGASGFILKNARPSSSSTPCGASRPGRRRSPRP